jgi:hypothetical protein
VLPGTDPAPDEGLRKRLLRTLTKRPMTQLQVEEIVGAGIGHRDESKSQCISFFGAEKVVKKRLNEEGGRGQSRRWSGWYGGGCGAGLGGARTEQRCKVGPSRSPKVQRKVCLLCLRPRQVTELSWLSSRCDAHDLIIRIHERT